MVETLSIKKVIVRICISLVLMLVVMCLCTMAGAQKISLQKAFTEHRQMPGENIDYEIFIIRLQRVILAAMVGAALACCGAVLQAILQNPLAEPYILGISSGAGLGTIIAIISGITWNFWAGSPITIFAFAGSLITVWLVWFIGYFAGKSQIISLLLAGVVVNSFFSAVIMFLISTAKSQEMRTTVMWLMGNITDKSPAVLVTGGVSIAAGLIILCSISNKLNIITLGHFQAQNLGINTHQTRLLGFTFAALTTAVAVSLSGLIGFVGLIVPHTIRLIFGPDHRQLLPLSITTGGIFLVLADTIARTVFGQEQLPVGVITAIAGGPFFLILLAKYTRKVS
jgi:iron complex transport system permease protein